MGRPADRRLRCTERQVDRLKRLSPFLSSGIRSFKLGAGPSLVVQWLRIRLPMQGDVGLITWLKN